MKALAIVLLFVVIGWLIYGAIFAFSGRMARQGLAEGWTEKIQGQRMRQERWAGRTARVMYRRLWPIPVVALAGFIVIAANYTI